MLQKSSLPRASLAGTSLPEQRCQILPSLLHGSWKLLGELFGTGAHGSWCSNCRLWSYWTSNIKALPTRKSVESLIQVSQYFVFFFGILKGKKCYVLNGDFKTGFLKWWCSFVAEVIITKDIFGRSIIARTEMTDPALLTPGIMKAIRWAFLA